MTLKQQIEQIAAWQKEAPKEQADKLEKLLKLGRGMAKLDADAQEKVRANIKAISDKLTAKAKQAESDAKAQEAKATKAVAKAQDTTQAAAKKTVQAAVKKAAGNTGSKSKQGPQSAGDTFFGRAKMIQLEKGISWKEAKAEAKAFFEKRKKEKAEALAAPLKKMQTKDPDDYARRTRNTSDVPRDAGRRALPFGKRKSKAGAKREYYWENRTNRADVEQRPKAYPKLAGGGLIRSGMLSRNRAKMRPDEIAREEMIESSLNARRDVDWLQNTLQRIAADYTDEFLYFGKTLYDYLPAEGQDPAIVNVTVTFQIGASNVDNWDNEDIAKQICQSVDDVLGFTFDSNSFDFDGVACKATFFEVVGFFGTRWEDEDGNELARFGRGGRPKSAHNRDHKYLSEEAHEKAYAKKAKRESRYSRAKKANGGTIELFKKGGTVEVRILNEGEKYDAARYQGVMGDYDRDGIANADDIAPRNPAKRGTVDDQSLAKVLGDVVSLKNSLDAKMYKFVDKLKTLTPSNGKVLARTKTPYSILKKLVEKRLTDKKKGLTDIVGTTIVARDKKDLDAVNRKVQAGALGDILDYEDMYEQPKGGYRAYHYIVEFEGSPIELQVKTARQKALNELSHAPYKAGKLNADKLLKWTDIAAKADLGDDYAARQLEKFLNQPNVEKAFYQS